MTAPKQATGEAFNIACNDNYSVLDLAQKLSAILGLPLKINHKETRSGDVKDSYADLKKANTLLNYVPQVNFHTGLEKTARWFQSHCVETII
jgi:UDP-N-acetylglucosamine 4-epimerase